MMTNTSASPNPGFHPLRVLLVDDAARVRCELRQLLELSNNLEIVGEAGDGSEAVRLAFELSPDVIVMDLEMPGMDGCEATRFIKTQQPATRVIILSIHSSPDMRQRARVAGADGFIVKGASYQTLINAILRKDTNLNSFEIGEKS
jgi:DNA-binding NarL/FixJ family response regulator